MNDTAEERLKRTLFIVEANSFEELALWRDTAKNSDCLRKGVKGLTWEQKHGWLITVGELDNRPCCISTSWVKIDGCLILFWYNCSQVTDSVQTDKWFEKHFKGTYDNGTRRATCDAMNFGHCLSAIKEYKKLNS